MQKNVEVALSCAQGGSHEVAFRTKAVTLSTSPAGRPAMTTHDDDGLCSGLRVGGAVYYGLLRVESGDVVRIGNRFVVDSDPQKDNHDLLQSLANGDIDFGCHLNGIVRSHCCCCVRRCRCLK